MDVVPYLQTATAQLKPFLGVAKAGNTAVGTLSWVWGSMPVFLRVFLVIGVLIAAIALCFRVKHEVGRIRSRFSIDARYDILFVPTDVLKKHADQMIARARELAGESEAAYARGDEEEGVGLSAASFALLQSANVLVPRRAHEAVPMLDEALKRIDDALKERFRRGMVVVEVDPAPKAQ